MIEMGKAKDQIEKNRRRRKKPKFRQKTGHATYYRANGASKRNTNLNADTDRLRFNYCCCNHSAARWRSADLSGQESYFLRPKITVVVFLNINMFVNLFLDKRDHPRFH
jgi:hypothetical protein